MEDFGNGWKTVHHYEKEFLSFGQPRHYHFHLSEHHRSRVISSGQPASVFCPKGSGLPTGVQAGYYTIGGNETTNTTRVDETICETGYFCEQGMKFRCPPGKVWIDARPNDRVLLWLLPCRAYVWLEYDRTPRMQGWLLLQWRLEQL